MYMKGMILSVVDLEDKKENGYTQERGYITMQHLPFFSGISSVGSGTRVVLSFSLGARLIEAGFGEGTRGLWGIVGVSLNWCCSIAGDLSDTGSVFLAEFEGCMSRLESGHCSFSRSFSSAIGSICDNRWIPVSSVLRRRKSVSYMEPTRPSFSHCSCCMRLACVGMICWSGGSRGSGLYMVAIQGASPSGRWPVVGRDTAFPL